MPATTTYGVDLLVELAIGQAADAATWGTGKWGTGRWGSTDTTVGDWVDVTCDVVGDVSLSAGSNTDDGVTRRWESASAAFVLDGPSFDPWNGPWRNALGDRTPVRVSWRTTGAPAWSRAFTGFVATRGYSWDPEAQEGHLAAVDGTSILVASAAVARPAAGAGESAAARVARIAAAALWPGGLDVTAGGSTLVATTLEGKAWDELLGVADTDLALLWINRAGLLAYRPRGRIGQGVKLAGRLVVCEAGPNDVGVLTMGAAQPSVSRNRVWVGRRKPDAAAPDPPVTYTEDRQSVARYQAHDYARTDLWHDTDAWSGVVADAVLAGGAWPSPAPGVAVLDTITGDPRVAALLLALEPDQVFDVVDDAGTVWREAVVGWDVALAYDGAEGRLDLEDVTRWSNPATWGTSKWGIDRWGIGRA